MNDMGHALIDYQVRSHTINSLEQHINRKILDIASSVPFEVLSTWQPYDNADILSAIRLSRLAEGSIILFDLDGYEELSNETLKREGLYLLMIEVQDDFANMIIGYPQVYASYNNKEQEPTYKIIWDIPSYSSSEINIPSEIWNTVDLPALTQLENEPRTVSRARSLNYRRWGLQQKAIAAQLFIDTIQNGCNSTNENSWIFDAINSCNIGNVELDEPDPLLEITSYVKDLDDLGIFELADTQLLEKYLKDVARRVHRK